MRIARVSASFLALAVFASPAFAAPASEQPAGGFVLAQAAGNPQVDKFLASRRAPASFPTDRLQKRLNTAKALLRRPDISGRQRSQLEAFIAASETELAKRGAAQAQGGQEQPAAQAEVPAQQETGEANAGKAKPRAPAAETGEIAAFLNNAAALNQMSPPELRNRARQAIVLSQSR